MAVYTLRIRAARRPDDIKKRQIGWHVEHFRAVRGLWHVAIEKNKASAAIQLYYLCDSIHIDNIALGPNKTKN